MDKCIFRIRSKRLDSSGNPMELLLDMTSHDGYPYRIHTVTGDSGVGKTTVLEKVAYALSGLSNELIETSVNFNSIVFVPFIPMDMLADNDGRIWNCVPSMPTPEHMTTDILEFYANMDANQKAHFKAIAKAGLGNTYLRFIRNLNASAKGNNTLSLSGRELLMVYGIACMCSTIGLNTFICMDSPEMVVEHSCMYGFMRTLNDMLEFYESHILLATDSPEVISETLGSNTTRLVRWSNPSQTVAKAPLFDNFACSASELMQDSDERLSYSCLKKRAFSMGESAIREELPDLGFNALLRLGLYEKDRR